MRIVFNLGCDSGFRSMVKYGYIRLSLNIKVDRGNVIEKTDRFLYRCGKNLPNGLLVLELDFCLRGMNIYIYVFGIHGEIDKIRHLLPYRNQTLK